MLNFFLLFSLSIFFSTSVYSQHEVDQETIGHLQGRVSDHSVGDVVPHVNIRLELDGALVKNTKTNADGDYSFREIEAGSYDLVAQSMGYPPLKIKGLQIDVDAILELDLAFPGETFDQDTVVYTFEELNTTSLNSSASKKKPACKKQSKALRRQQRAAKRLN
ncbi:MAG: carboxypeptidase regulatory-like domain-containing protein [Aureispira sp.]|nr:carboxypeptidase regulatory-like domain-containing protein [Aureispira sp.]